MAEDRITFKCTDCGHAVVIDQSKPPKDDDILKCFGCGREFGPYKTVKAAMIKAGKSEIEKMVFKAFGKKPVWKKG
ncbi:MAG: hypothetical protein KGJ78_17470 [Alphaproteobacteria bacterium]|nr:hypothetical protein [Alphaproteobacteria bacterium]